ncbi:heavy metal sensor histidine kinase [Cupriavidus sp. 30B13]|uniref:heavy metal sensor histidine kinase n=1 Tax=Cupriavidus sp. 30B13 TaxID=3384241 RepID=UPI003B902F86
MNRSLSVRLAVWFAVVSLAAYALVALGLYLALRAQLTANLKETLATRSDLAATIVRHVETAAKWQVVRARLADVASPNGSALLHVASADPRFAFGDAILGGDGLPPGAGSGWIQPAGHAYPMLFAVSQVPALGERPAVALTVAVDGSAAIRTLQRLRVTLAVLSVVVMLTMLLLSFSVARMGLRPLFRLSEEAGRLSTHDRSKRLGTDALPRELRHLAEAFNGALARLDRSYERLECFNADVAHELRTPIGIVVGQTEVALTRDRSAAELRSTLQSNLEEIGRLKHIVNDMLFLSRVDRGEYATGCVEASLGRETQQLLSYLDTLFEDAGIASTVSGDARAEINVALFQRALSNLLANAIEHSSPGATVAISIAQTPGFATVAVANPGAAIEAEKLARLFDRFVRGAPSRETSRENHGLGLAIVKAVAEMHGGSVAARSAGGVNTFSFSLPLRQSPGRPAANRRDPAVPAMFARRRAPPLA